MISSNLVSYKLKMEALFEVKVKVKNKIIISFFIINDKKLILPYISKTQVMLLKPILWLSIENKATNANCDAITELIF